MKIVIMGTGAIGGYFGGRLAAAGVDVSFVARGAQLEALRTNGLQIKSSLGDLHLPSVQVSDDPGAFGAADLVMLMVKLYDTENAARLLAPLLGTETSIVTFQNGIDGWQRAGAIVGMERMILGTAYIPASVPQPGVISHNGPFARLVFGEADGRPSARGQQLESTLQAAGIEARLVDDIEVKLWEKLIVLGTLSATTALTRLSIGPIRDDPVSAELLRTALEEAASVARAVCPQVPENAAEHGWKLLSGFPEKMRASMAEDLEKGKPLELDGLSGTIARLGREHGIPTPTHEFVWRALHPFIGGAAG